MILRLINIMTLSILLVACEGAEQDSSEPPALNVASQSVAEAQCGAGGTACPDPLECVDLYGGEQQCRPMAHAAVVLITDVSLGGRCVMPDAIDEYPGMTIGTVEVIAEDTSTLGYGRLLWDKPGYEVAINRGTAPNGTAFSGDICTQGFNLGCDGQVIIEIVDENGVVQKLREGQNLFISTRGEETCGEKSADGFEAMICYDPAAAAGGNLDSCRTDQPMIPVDEEMYGPDKYGGTIRWYTPE